MKKGLPSAWRPWEDLTMIENLKTFSGFSSASEKEGQRWGQETCGWVGNRSTSRGRAEGSPLLTVLVPDGALVGVSSLRTFLLITLEAVVRFWVVPVLKDT